jgi:hypothetical protein
MMQGQLSDRLKQLFAKPAVNEFTEVFDNNTRKVGTIKMAQMLLKKIPVAYFSEAQELVEALLFEDRKLRIHPEAETYFGILSLCVLFISILQKRESTPSYSEHLFKLTLNFAKELAKATAHVHEMNRFLAAIHQTTVIVPVIQTYKAALAHLNGRTKDYSWFVEDLSAAFFAAMVTSGHRTGVGFLDNKIAELDKIMQNRVNFYLNCQRAVLHTQALLDHPDPVRQAALLKELSEVKAQLVLVHDEPKALCKRDPLSDSSAPEAGKACYRSFIKEFYTRLDLLEKIISKTADVSLMAKFKTLHCNAVADIETLIAFPLEFFKDSLVVFIAVHYNEMYHDTLQSIINTCKQKMQLSLAPDLMDLLKKFGSKLSCEEMNQSLTEFQKRPLALQKIILFYGLQGRLKAFQEHMPEEPDTMWQQVGAKITDLLKLMDEDLSPAASSSFVIRGGSGGAASGQASAEVHPH